MRCKFRDKGCPFEELPDSNYCYACVNVEMNKWHRLQAIALIAKGLPYDDKEISKQIATVLKKEVLNFVQEKLEEWNLEE